MNGPYDEDEFFDPLLSKVARLMLCLSEADIAARTGLSVADIIDYEAGRLRPMPFNSMPDEIGRAQRGRYVAELIRSVLEGAGVRLVPPGEAGEGVRFRKPRTIGQRWRSTPLST